MNADELQSILSTYLPNAGATKAISVGFENVDALVPLRIILDDYFKKVKNVNETENEKNRKAQENADKKIISDWTKLFTETMKEQKQKLENIASDTKKQLEHSQELVKLAEEKNKQVDVKDENDLKKTKAFAKRFLNASIDVLKKYLDNAVELGNVYVDIESNGVFLKNGFKDLGEATNKLGMTHQELASHLKKTSPLIAKLNGSMGNGIKSFQSAISGIDDNLNLTNKEKVAIFENVLTNMSPDKLMNMSQEQMNVEINKTAKEMKMLAMATGKSVDLINQENAQRESTHRQQVWKRTHQASFNVLKALGLDKDQEMMDYIMSGGTKATANILTRMQNDPFMQKVLPQMIRMANTNQLNMGTAASLYNQNKHLVGYKSAYANRASFDPAMMAAAASSDYFQNTAYNDTFGEAFMKMNLNGDMTSQYFSTAREGANSALGNHIGLTRAMGRYDAATLEALSGGENGVSFATDKGSKLYNAGAWGINKYNSIVGGLFGGAISGIGASAVAVNKEQIFSAAVDRFAWAVNLMIGSQLFKSFLGKGKGLLGKAGSAGAKVLGGVKKVGAGALNLAKSGGKGIFNLGKGAVKLGGKLAAPIVSLAQTAGVGYDMATKGVSGTVDEYKNNWKWYDYLNPSKMATVGGGWIGDKIGDAAYSISKWWNGDDKSNVKPISNTSIKTSSKESKTEMENTAVLKEIRDYMRINASNSQSLIDLTDENVKINENQLLYNKTKGGKEN